jgi:hypothetical protein
MFATELAALYQRDLSRLAQELRAFPDTPSLWQVVPGVTNGAGTLALHLDGNLREYIGRALGGIAYQRDRPLEFSARGATQDQILERVDSLREMVPRVIGALSQDTLDATYPDPYDGGAIVTRQLLVHMLAHLNYHLGQIDYLRRCTTGQGAIALAALR